MTSFRDITRALDEIDVQSHSRLILHARIEPFTELVGGVETLVGALLNRCELLVVPAFTPQTMIVPTIGPNDNAMEYGQNPDANLEAVIFSSDLPVDPQLGEVNETIRKLPDAQRSEHPILSFAGINAAEALAAQTLDAPLGSIAWLGDYDADVLMIGCEQSYNVSIHWGEQLAGRRSFTRWALTPGGVVECPNMPGCVQGFNWVRGRLGAITRRTMLGTVLFEAIPVRDLLNLTVGWIREDPRALLCDRTGCPHCSSVRAAVRVEQDTSGL
jgi:aminoglycoside 3-N-acetyltransferase